MSRRHPIYHWAQRLAPHFPGLTTPQVFGLALWSYGLVQAGSCALTAVLNALTIATGSRWDSLRSRLKEWYLPAAVKSGTRRRDWDVTTCFPGLLRWVLAAWPATQLALALDATSLGARFTVLTLSIVYRAGAIPVAWKVLPANVAHPWEPEWIALLRAFRDRLTPAWSGTVLVLSDRGLYARWLFQEIVALGWHPLMRITRQSRFLPAGWAKPRAVGRLVPGPGHAWQGRGVAFPRKPGRRLDCTLLVLWTAGHEDGWYVLTDLAPQGASGAWYGLRSWIEAGFRHVKSEGWHWDRTHMSDPARAERLWLAIAVAECWVQSHAEEVAALFPRRPHLVSAHRRGLGTIRWRLRRGHLGLDLGAWRPREWPSTPPAVITVQYQEEPYDPSTRNPPQ
jgi:hypothetical protein